MSVVNVAVHRPDGSAARTTASDTRTSAATPNATRCMVMTCLLREESYQTKKKGAECVATPPLVRPGASRSATASRLVYRGGAAADRRTDRGALLPVDDRAHAGARGRRPADDERRL